MKQKRNEDEESIEDVDDEEFEKMIGNLFTFMIHRAWKFLLKFRLKQKLGNQKSLHWAHLLHIISHLLKIST